MPGCVLTDPSEIARRDQLIHAAEVIGSKTRPLITQFCEYHKQHHAIQVGGKISEMYQSVNLTQDEEKETMVFQHKEYCRTCASYHLVGQCRGPRNRETVGA